MSAFKVAFSPVYKYQLPAKHRFPMVKYELLPQQLLYEGTLEEDDFFHPDQLTEEEILWTHTQEYWQKLKTRQLSKKEIRKIGFPLRADLVERGLHISKGTVQCALYALDNGVSLNVAGGTHHAFADHGEGFCLLNDFAIASNYLLHHQKAKKILIIDLDVHQGNGTARIFENTEKVFTFSVHGAKNYPIRKENSDLDIGLSDGCQDEEYLKVIQKWIPRVIEMAKPDFIFYLAGVDVLATDKLGRLALSMEGCKKRDEIVFEICFKYQIPVAVSMGGGYSEKISDIINAHANTFRMAKHIYF